MVTVQHAPLKPGDDESIDAFEGAIAKGIKERAMQNRFTLEEVSQQLRATLLRRLQQQAELLITPEALAKIHGAASAAEARSSVKHICHDMTEFLRSELILMSGLPFRGRSRQFLSRDRQISKMRRNGRSYGEIANELGIKRNAVQAAYRRETRRRDLLCKNYPTLKCLYAAVGVNLEEVRH